MELTVNKSSKLKIIKRYQNRKLYDTQQSCYVTLDDIARMIRTNEEILVIDNKSKSDITSSTLLQILFESEKRASQYAPISILRDIIQHGNGGISGYLCKLGAFSSDLLSKQTYAKHSVDHVLSENSKSIPPLGLNLNFTTETDASSKSVADKAILFGSDNVPATLLPGHKLEY